MLSVPLNDLRRGFLADRAKLHEAVAGVLDSGWYVHGLQHEQFERAFADYVGVEHCIGVASGTDALELALTAMTSPGKDVVVTAANAGGYASVAARRSGLRVRYADVLPDTLCLDPAQVEAALRPDVAAVVVTHLYGRLADVDAIRQVCARSDVPLVEDCAQSVGAAKEGRRAGSFGMVGTFSFYPTKNLGALGDGGALTTDDPELAQRLRALRQYGWSSKYVIEVPSGRNSRLDEVQAAALLARLPDVDTHNARRREIIGRYAAAGSRTVSVLRAAGEGHVGHLAVALCDDRTAARAALAAASVATDVHYPVPDHRQPALSEQHDGRPLPVTEEAARRVVTLPCFPHLTDVEVDQVCDVLAAL